MNLIEKVDIYQLPPTIEIDDQGNVIGYGERAIEQLNFITRRLNTRAIHCSVKHLDDNRQIISYTTHPSPVNIGGIPPLIN